MAAPDADHLVGSRMARRGAAIVVLAARRWPAPAAGPPGDGREHVDRGRPPHRGHTPRRATSKPAASIAGAEVGRLPKVPEADRARPARRTAGTQRERLPDGGVPRRRGDVDAGVRGGRPAVHAGAVDDLPRPGPHGLRHAERRRGPVLLPGRSRRLSRHALLRPARPHRRRQARGLRAGLRGRARGRPSRAGALGITGRVGAADQQDPAGTNARSVRLELQADCFAGIWKHATYERGQLTAADFEDALRPWRSSATTSSSAAPPGRSRRRTGRTARPSSASIG